MKKPGSLLAFGLLIGLCGLQFTTRASARECWSAVGAAAEADEQSSAFLVRGAIPGPPVVSGGSSTPRGPTGPAVVAGQTSGWQDHMVSLKRSAPPGAYVLRHSAVPTAFFDTTPRSQLNVGVYLQDHRRDRVVVQLKEIRYRATAVAIDPKPQVKTIAVVDTVNDPFFFQDNVPSGRFVVLHSDLFSIAGTRQISIPDSEPFIGREFVHYFVEAMLITDRPARPIDVGVPTGVIRGPALAFVAACPAMDMNTCFFKEANFGGDRLCLRGNESLPKLDPSWNDQISSLWVAEGGIVLVCENRHFDPLGWCDTYAGAVRELKGDRNKAISSIMRIR